MTAASTRRIVDVDGDKLILETARAASSDRASRSTSACPSLEIEGTLTQMDRAYLAAMRQVGLAQAMLSYTERTEDAVEVRAAPSRRRVDAQDRVAAWPRLRPRQRRRARHLVAARGDLFVEIGEPHRIVGALRQILAVDPEAMAASRIFSSLAFHPVPECAEICDVAFLLSLGYRTFLLGDEVCLRRDSVMAALNLLQAVAGEMD